MQYNDSVFVNRVKWSQQVLLPFITKHVIKLFFLVMRTFKVLAVFQICSTVLLTIVIMWYITSQWRIYFITGTLYHWLPSPISPTPHPLPLATSSLFSVSVSLALFFCFVFIWFVCFFFFLKNPHISEITWYLSFSAWFISLSIMPSRSYHVVTNGKIPFFFMAE